MPTLRQIAAQTRMLEVACARCPRRGRLSVERLIREHGPDTTLLELLETIGTDRPHREAWRLQDRCWVCFPGLVAAKGGMPDAPSLYGSGCGGLPCDARTVERERKLYDFPWR